MYVALLAAGMLDGETLTCDGCHPKDAGLTIMAAEIKKAIMAAL